jgi:hypothetical protein
MPYFSASSAYDEFLIEAITIGTPLSLQALADEALSPSFIDINNATSTSPRPISSSKSSYFSPLTVCI